MTPEVMRGAGWGGVLVGLLLVGPTGGASLLVVLLGVAALVVGGRRRRAARTAAADELLARGRVRLHADAGHDEASHLRSLLERARGADGPGGGR